MPRHLLPLLLLGSVACAPEPDPTVGVAADDGELVIVSANGARAGIVTITGKVFYNDRRDHGLFSTRRTMSGSVGQECGTDGVRDDGSSCSTNWLGAYYMVVDVIERDTGYFAPTAWDCQQEDLLATATVGYNGSFSVTFTASDECDSDNWSNPAIALRVRTRFCNSSTYCFSVDESWNDYYSLWYPGASHDDPLLVTGGNTYTLGSMLFYPSTSTATTANDTAIAANYYASLVDTVMTVHRDAGIPFYYDEFGEVQVIYPSNDTSSATTLTASKVVLVDKDDWIKGEVIAHEYGHVVNLRAWDGSYGWNAVGVEWNANEPLEKRLAFKEGWANFMSRAVFTETRPCDGAFDDNGSTALKGTLGAGAKWATNVTKMLCDWYDWTNDDDPSIAGTGDHFHADDLYSVWYNLRRMYLDADDYGGDFNDGLEACDYVDYYLDVRKSAAAVGTASHNDYVDWITDLIYNNNITCGFPSP